jgi:hypothetical protein
MEPRSTRNAFLIGSIRFVAVAHLARLDFTRHALHSPDEVADQVRVLLGTHEAIEPPDWVQ